MFPEEILTIITKYVSDDSKFISDINKNIINISSILKAINTVIADKLQELVNDIDTNDNESELLQDSKTLRTFIKTIETIGSSNDKHLVEEINHNTE